MGLQGLPPDVSPARKASSRPLPEANFQVAAHTDSSLLLLGGAVWGACLGHITWGAVAAVRALGVLAVTVGAERSRPVQVITLIDIHTGHLGHVQLEALKAVTGVALLHTHTAAILTAIQDATLLCLKPFEAGLVFWMAGHIVRLEF